MANFYAFYPPGNGGSGSGGGSGNPAAGPTGAPVPADADYVGFSVAGILTGVSAATPLPVTLENSGGLSNVNIADFGGTAVTIGQQLMTASMPVVLASNQSSIPVTGSGNFTVVQPTGTNLHTVVDSGTITANQGTSPWIVAGGGTAGTPATGVVTVQGIAGGTSIPVTGTFNNSSVAPVPGSPPADATYVGGLSTTAAPTYVNNDLEPLSLNLAGGLRVDGSGVTQPVSAVSLPLPTGASTSANQTNGSQKSQVVDGANATVGPVQTISGTNYLPVVLAASATPGSAIVARSIQVAGSDGTNAQTLSTDSSGKLNINTIAGTVKTSSPVNANATFTGSLSVTTTEGSTAAPANAVGVVFEAESSNATNIRWGVSNSAGTILSTSSGVLMEPGRSIDFLPIGTGTFLHYISTAAGSNVIDIQWILSA